MTEDTGDHGSWIKTKMLRGSSTQPASGTVRTDIGGLWGQQRRIRRAESLEERRRQQAQKQIIEQRGVVGLARLQALKLTRRAKRILFGRQALQKQPSAKTVEINVKLPSLPKLLSPAKLKRIWLRLPKPLTIGLLIFVVMAVITFAGYQLSHRPVVAKVRGAATQQTTGPVHGTPSYPTLLPAGKDIRSLGGWYLISPPGRDPVYAYSDKINDIQVDVSEQPLPAGFKDNTDAQIAQLAQSFSANDKLATPGIAAYIGTSIKGPQSVILSKSNLLILIKSGSVIPDDQWVAYISSLQ